MLRFIGQRVTFILLVCVFIVFAVYLGMGMIRNSEVQEPSYNLVTRSQLAWTETREFLKSALNGRLGTARLSIGFVNISDLLAESYRNSMGLLLLALLAGSFFGLSAGSFAALTRHNRLVFPVLALTVIGISTPSFFAGLLLRQAELKYVSVFGHPLVSIAGFGWDYKHMLLPVLVLMARPLAYLTRTTFLSLDRAMQEDYIRTAYAKGLAQPRTVNVHAVKNIAVPILTAIGVSLRFSLGTLPVVEFLFLWPGLGLRLLEAIDLRQADLAAALAVSMGLTFLGVNLLLDVLYRFVDPRLRTA